MAILSKQQLKDLWVTGYTPTQTDYANLFDTIISYVNGNLPSNYKFISGQISTEEGIDTHGFGILWYDNISTCDFLFIISGAEDTNASEGPRFLLYQGEQTNSEGSLSKDETKTSEEIINTFVYGNPEGTGAVKNPIWELPTTPEVSLSANTTWSNLANLPDTSKLNLNTVLSSIFFALGLREDNTAAPFRFINGQQGDANLFGIVWKDLVNTRIQAILFSPYGQGVPFIALYQTTDSRELDSTTDDDLVQNIYTGHYDWQKIWEISSETKTVQPLQHTLQDTGTTETVYVLVTPGSVTEAYNTNQRARITVKFSPQSISHIDWKDMSYQPAIVITYGYATVVFDDQSATTDISRIYYDADSPSEELMNHRTDTVNGNSGSERRVYTIRAVNDGLTEKVNLFISWKYYADDLYTYPPLE